MLRKIMKILMIISVLFVYSTLLADDTTFLVRGPAQGELYLGTPYYSTYDGGYEQHTYYAISHSFGNGEHIDIKYVSEDLLTDSLHINCPWLVSDATPGVIYCRSQNYKLWISYTYGEDWNFIETTSGYYTSGCIEGEIYKRLGVELYRSDNYGQNFVFSDTLITGGLEVGTEPGELYGIKNINPGSWGPYAIYYCEDYGADFVQQCILDSTIAAWDPYPKLSHGTAPGELYMVTYHAYGNYFIYRSIDYGQTFELMYQFPSIPVVEWSTHYTAGSQPGSFYFIKYRWVWAYSYSKDDVIVYVEMYIYYSDDYAGTFSEVYYHSLNPDSTSVDENEVIEINNINLINYPNPFNPTTEIRLQISDFRQIENAKIEVYNIKGQKIKTIPINCLTDQPINSVIWNGTDENDNQVSSGIYLYKLNIENSPIKKMMLLK
ncbi:MAG: T9SS type A sorting domain-containing protein [Candidatus Cloacimonadales bacterium]|nr:T9SS type A sorting domain-containing protein [Candidatus Cloacimonadales bacterium]